MKSLFKSEFCVESPFIVWVVYQDHFNQGFVLSLFLSKSFVLSPSLSQSFVSSLYFQGIVSSLQSTLTGDGKQPAHNPQRVEQACTIYCKSKAGDWYSPQLELSRCLEIFADLV